MHKLKFLLLTALIPLLLASCGKTAIECTEDGFCELIQAENFEDTGAMIDAFLTVHSNGNDDRQLRNLEEWLECKSCVNKVKILCNSCIETYPAQSEMEIDFEIDGQVVTKILDVSMGRPLSFAGYHE